MGRRRDGGACLVGKGGNKERYSRQMVPYHYRRLMYGQRVKPRVEGRVEVKLREVDWGQVGKSLNKCHFIPME